MLIYKALKKDYMKVKQLLCKLVAVRQDNAESRHGIIKNIHDELISHARAGAADC